ncbi:hypothetical protein [Sphingomonas sp. TREG-RG-20F-R18-01]|uniref:hypothetical protein n=1 Tax=Sphingomonas sp. TREG-RG-20F-R18-01 TaxID=2914982 RepID=UPI001F585F0A|nr:hypothetical protein [Sphingomonas sp. TREG-RG-20F-R18-01]
MKVGPNQRDPVFDAEWLAHRYDPEQDAVHFRHVPLSARARATFLTDEYLGVEPAPVPIGRERISQSALPNAPLHFVFHSAFCLSTLLANALDLPGRSMSLKEPVILNDIVGWRHRGADGTRLTAVLLDALQLCARPGPGRRAVVVKPSNIANGLADGMLRLLPQARALLLHAPLEDYLISIAKKQIDGRLWVRDLMVKQLREGLTLPVFSDEDLLRLTDLQVAAVGWLSQHALFHRLCRAFPERVRTLDSATITASPASVVQAMFAFYGIALSDEERAQVLAGPAFTQHSKDGTAFGFSARSLDYAAAESVHRDELTKVAAWARVVAETAGVPMALPNRLC